MDTRRKARLRRSSLQLFRLYLTNGTAKGQISESVTPLGLASRVRSRVYLAFDQRNSYIGRRVTVFLTTHCIVHSKLKMNAVRDVSSSVPFV
jgi:hypothetical protein